MIEITNYLKKSLDEAMGNVIELKENLDIIDIKIKENTRFIEMLIAENEKPFSEFTPRTVNYKNSDKIEKLKVTTEEQKSEKEDIENKIKSLENNISELKSMITLSEKEETTVIDNIDSHNDNTNIKDKINNIISYLPADPLRAKIELENLKNNL